MCTCLDVGAGEGVFARPWERWVQAQMWRAGVDLGDVDGYWGAKTRDAAKYLGLLLGSSRGALEAALMALPNQLQVTYRAN